MMFDLVWVWQSVKMRAGHARARAGMPWLAAFEAIYLVVTSGSVRLPSLSGIISITAEALAVVPIVFVLLPSAQPHSRALRWR